MNTENKMNNKNTEKQSSYTERKHFSENLNQMNNFQTVFKKICKTPLGKVYLKYFASKKSFKATLFNTAKITNTLPPSTGTQPSHQSHKTQIDKAIK